MGASASVPEASRDKKKLRRSANVASLFQVADGTIVQVVGLVEAEEPDEMLTTPFGDTPCIAMDVQGASQHWRSQHALRNGAFAAAGPSYDPGCTVLRATHGTSFVLRDWPVSYLVESPGGATQLITSAGAALRVVVPTGSSAARRRGTTSWILGHKQWERDLRFDPAHGVLLQSEWEIIENSSGRAPTARLLSPIRRAPAHAHLFWNAHCSSRVHACDNWNQLVNHQTAPCWMRKYRVNERTLRAGDTAAVIGELRHTDAGGLELHCGQQGLMITNVDYRVSCHVESGRPWEWETA